MSHTIVKAASVHKASDGTFYCRMVGDANNVTPRHYRPFTCLEGRKTKDEIESILLAEFVRGGLQGSYSRYGAFVREIDAGVIDSPTVRRYHLWRNAAHKAFDDALTCRAAHNEEGRLKAMKEHEHANKRADETLDDPALLAEFRKWKPDERRYEIQVKDGGWVHSMSTLTFRYGRTRVSAKDFSAVAAYEFRNKFGRYSPTLFEVRKSA